MSILARQRAADPAMGYARDFVGVMARELGRIAAKGVKIVSNAGGVNPEGCADALRAHIDAQGLDLTVATVTGDDLMDRLDTLAAPEMFTNAPFPDPESVRSANAYLGAFPIAKALELGADIVVTGRCVDSAVTLGPLIHEFGWTSGDLDLLAQGSLAGHINECGTQVTGGNFTDWKGQDFAAIGYPIMECEADGSFVVTKVAGTGGKIGRATVGEQLLYEIGDPGAYVLPDVVCDFTEVQIEEVGEARVRVTGARGAGVPRDYKASITFQDGYKLSALFFMIGEEARTKARTFCDAALARAGAKLDAIGFGPFTETHVEVMGDESHYGAFAEHRGSRELTFKIAVKHPEARACALLLKEATGLALSAPPGLALYTGGRPKPQEVTRLFNARVPKSGLRARVRLGDRVEIVEPATGTDGLVRVSHSAPEAPIDTGVAVALHRLAWLRSGDKGDKANIGVLAREPEYLPYIWTALTPEAVTERFAHFGPSRVERFHLPGLHAMNLLLHDVLGGGGMASLRNDSQGKAYGQILAAMEVPVPARIARRLEVD